MSRTKTSKQPALDWLLREAASLFTNRLAPNETYQFTLGKFPSGWTFRVVDSWHRWMDMKLKHEFGNYQTPEQAVQAFLDYVSENRIEVSRLQER